jgi:hypothetical protein
MGMDLRTAILQALDPVELWKAVYHTTPDVWQEMLLRSDHPRVILNVCRQGGKSSVVAIKALHGALYHPKSLILLLSRSLRQSQELARKVFDGYAATGRKIPADSESRLCLELKNGSRVLALPGGDQGSIRGFSGVSGLYIDETAQCSDELYIALRPMVSVSQGSITLLSTPFGKRGFFYRAWAEGQGWLKIRVPADECPRLAPEFLAEERRELGRLWYSQEYDCAFVETALNPFHPEDIDAAIRADIEPMFPGRRFRHVAAPATVLDRC